MRIMIMWDLNDDYRFTVLDEELSQKIWDIEDCGNDCYKYVEKVNSFFFDEEGEEINKKHILCNFYAQRFVMEELKKDCPTFDKVICI